MAQTIDIQELLDAGGHFGHLTRKWHPKMAPYIFMERNGIHIIDLHKTAAKMEEAGEAPVPPSAPEMTIRSAFAFATPAAIVPTPLSATSFTLIRACGFTFFRSNINWAKSSME